MDPLEAMDIDEVQLPEELDALSTLIDSKPEALATGDKDIQLAALRATKFVYDLALKSEAQSRAHIAELLTSISPALAPQTRSQAAESSKRKRSPSPPSNTPAFNETPLTELFVENMNEDQIWEQLELRAKNVCEVLEYALDGADDEEAISDEDDEDGMAMKRKLRKLEAMGEDELDEDEMDEDEDSDEEDEDDNGEESSEVEDEEEDEEDAESADLGEHIAELRDSSGSDEELDLDKSSFAASKRPSRRKPKAGGHPELDDGFFDLAAFNAETEAAEAQNVSKGRLGGDDDDDEAEDDDPVDYFAPVDDNDEGALDGDADGETNEPFYKDFFDPPPRDPPSKSKSSKPQQPASGKVRFHEEVRVKKIKAKGKSLPVSVMYGDDDDDDDEEDSGEEYEDDNADHDSMSEGEDGVQDESGGSEEEDADGYSGDDDLALETAEHLKNDLFADDETEETGLTTHQKRMAALQEEIAALEAENVAKKDWTLMGEATSRSRPQNSLLEEDLEFERLMKAVPVITEETVQGLEERIKTRILESQFDDVVRKRPVDDKPFLPPRFFELQDTKSKQSLAEIYEDEFTAAQSGGIAGEDRDGKLKKEHDEITKIWENITSKLDALCNAHFTPKAPKASISTISNVAAATLESALPTTRSTSTMLAPEEIFTPSLKDLRAKSELTPAQKRAEHNKQKKMKKKARDVLEKSVDKFAKTRGIGGVKKQKEEALKSLVKSGKGVTVVGKKSKDLAERATRKKTAT